MNPKLDDKDTFKFSQYFLLNPVGSEFIKTMESVFPYTTPYVYPIGLIAQTASVYLTVLVTVERYIAVCHPLKAKLMCTEFR